MKKYISKKTNRINQNNINKSKGKDSKQDGGSSVVALVKYIIGLIPKPGNNR